jgi:prevent-host-death family protein
MAPTTPTETRMKLSDTKQQLSKLVNQVAQGQSRVVVEKSGLAVAAIISTEEYQRFLEMERERAQRFAALSRISAALADVPVDELEAEVARTLAETRASRSRRREKTNSVCHSTTPERAASTRSIA